MGDLYYRQFRGAKVVASSNFTINDSFDYSVNQITAWDTASYDPMGMWSAGDPSKLTVVVPGLYMIEAQVALTASGLAGDFGLVVNRDGWGNGGVGTSKIAWGEQQIKISTNVAPSIRVFAFSVCTAGQYWESLCVQKTTANKTADSTASWFAMTYLGEV